MCFSATASFAVGAVLIPTGLYTTSRAIGVNPRHAPFAAFPLAFGIQQVFEGMVWLALGGHTILDQQTAALGFTFFSHFFWLLWVPLSVWILDDRKTLGWMGLVVTLIAGLYGASLYVPLFLYDGWLQVVLIQGSINYNTILIYDGLISRLALRAIYAVLIVVPMLFCLERYIRLFGILIAVTVAVAVFLYGYAFISVWCFFAAIVSLYLAYAIPRFT